MRITQIKGKAIEDAVNPVVIKVSKGDIKGGVPKNPSKCVIARTCRRQLKTAAKMYLTRIYILNGKGTWYRYMVPRNLRAEIIAFDRGGKFFPDEFVLHPPSPSKKLGYSKHGNTPHKDTGLKPRRKPIYVRGVRTGPANLI